MMDDAKKLKDSELEQACGGDNRYGDHDGYVINKNGTDLCFDFGLMMVKKHLEYATVIHCKDYSKGILYTKIWTDNGEFGYVKTDDIK